MAAKPSARQQGQPAAGDGRADAQLLAAIAQSRDQSALDELLRRYERDAYNVAYRIAGRSDAAEEVVQDAMMRVWTSAASYRGEGQVRAWLLRIVARESIHLIRARKRKSMNMESDAGNETHFAESSPHSPLGGAEASELTHALRREVDRLPENERQLIALHFGGGLSQPEISDALSIPQQTISYRIGGILKTLRSNLSAGGYGAAIPLLADGFGEVLRTGMDAPSGLREKIASSLANRNSFRTNRSVRKTAAHSKAGGWAVAGAATLAVVAAAGVVWLVLSKPAPQPFPTLAPVKPDQPALAQKAPEQEPEAAVKTVIDLPVRDKPMERPADWHRRWTFEKGAPSDLFVMMGEWTWNRDTQSMDIPNTIHILPTYLLPGEPLLFTAKGLMIDVNNKLRNGLRVVKNHRWVSAVDSWLRPHRLQVRDMVLQCYIYRQTAVLVMGDEPGMVFEYGESLEDAVVFLQFDNYSIHELIATPLNEDEVPDFVKHPDQLKKELTKQ
jgi:RNA polymerase sigma-70 factor (ECF subfamily)